MFEREKKWLKSFDNTTWFYVILFGVSLALLKTSFAFHPDTSGDFLGNVRVEFIGFCFDVLFLGLIFSVFMQRYQKQQDIKRWQEEIDDYRFWNEKEAIHRIVGNVKRLNKAGVSKVNLHFCYLENAYLHNANIQNSDLHSSFLKNAILDRSNFQGSYFNSANLCGVTLSGCIFENTNLTGTQFDEALFCSDLLLGMPLSFIENSLMANGAGCYPFFDGAIVGELEWFEYLKKSKVHGALVMETVYEICYENERYIIRVKPEKRDDYNYFKALAISDESRRSLVWAKRHPELLQK